jgi:hypothetical protein
LLEFLAQPLLQLHPQQQSALEIAEKQVSEHLMA